MVTQKEAYNHYMNLYNNGAIYVWGFNANTVISKTTIDKAYNTFKTTKYNRSYYDKKLKEGLGKIGSDCSGAHCAISGYDTTAQNYYNRCTKKGTIDNLPKNKLVLLFTSDKNKSDKKITHTGVYLGNGMCFHMASSSRNAVLESVDVRGWQYWGYADFISDYDTFSFKESLSNVRYSNGDVNIRKQADSSKANIVGVASKDDLILITSDIDSRGWAKVECLHNNKLISGYMNTKYTRETDLTFEIVKTTTTLNLRTGKSTEFDVIQKTAKNVEMYCNKKGSWTLCVVNNHIGYSNCSPKHVN